MPEINLQALHAVMEESVEPLVIDQLGPDAGTHLVQLLMVVKQVYHVIAPEQCQGTIHVLRSTSGKLLSTSEYQEVRAASLDLCLAGLGSNGFVLQITDFNEFVLWRSGRINVAAMTSTDFIIYEYHFGVERLYARGQFRVFRNLYLGQGSAFTVPTFSDLGSALEHYSIRLARKSTCRILAGIWLDSSQVLLVPKPEHIMRRSLTQYLMSVLRTAEVRPEQIVDESHPVDIKVTWIDTKRHAIIEIKWLGRSKDPSTGKITADYSESRAHAGASQLANYLDEDGKSSADFVNRGYLVVFDARRKNSRGSKKPSQADLNHFAAQEISYPHRYEDSRTDFNRPFRIYLEPVSLHE